MTHPTDAERPRARRRWATAVSARWAFYPALGLLVFIAQFVMSVVAGASADLARVEAGLILAIGVAVSRLNPAVAVIVTGFGVFVGGAQLPGGGLDPVAVAAFLTASYVGGRFGGTITRVATPIYYLAIAGFVGLNLAGAYSPSEASPLLAALPDQLVVTFGLFLVAGVLAIVLLAPWTVGLIRQLRAAKAGEPPRTGRLKLPPSIARSVTPLDSRIDGALAILYLGFVALTLSNGVDGSALAAVVFTVALLLRRVSPPLALAFAWLGSWVQMASLLSVSPMDVAVLAVLYATAAYGSRLTRLVGLASAGVGAAIAAAYLVMLGGENGRGLLDPTQLATRAGLVQFAMFGVLSAGVLGLAWTVGLLMRTVIVSRAARSAQAASEGERVRAEHEVASLQERNRIARDMHDVVAHSLAVVIAQADGARYVRASDPAAVDEALVTISTVARDALGDVRGLLAQLRHSAPAGPQPGLDDLDSLVGQSRAAGLDLILRRSGEPRPVPQPVGLALYRIAQEALTNALRHGERGSPVSIDLSWAEASVALRVVNGRRVEHPLSTGPSAIAAPGGGVGHGLAGMRERAVLVGGSVEAGPDGGAFVVRAFVPLPSRATLAQQTIAVPPGPSTNTSPDLRRPQ